MGPRDFSRGGHFDGITEPVRQQLQWGRGFLAAETRPFLKLDGPARVASMGPRVFSRGDKTIDQAFLLAVCASMGPRVFSRGDFCQGFRASSTKTGFNGAAGF